jgi:hypothetical protein
MHQQMKRVLMVIMLLSNGPQPRLQFLNAEWSAYGGI